MAPKKPCNNCKEVKALEDFFPAKERYYKHKDRTLNGELPETEQQKEQERLENRKKTIQESNQRRKEIVFSHRFKSNSSRKNKESSPKNKINFIL